MTGQTVAFLERAYGLTPELLAPFAHGLRSTHEGHLFAPHHGDGDGEEYGWQIDGSLLEHFTDGRRDEGRGRGPSVWSADPEPSAPLRFVLVAESVPVALAAAAKLDPEARACTRIVSTAGDLSEAGKRKLVKLIREAQQECVRAGGGKLVLLDASNVGEPRATVRADSFYRLAAFTGARYERWESEGYKDWTEVLVAEQRAREAASAEAVGPASPQAEQDPPKPSNGRGRRGRGK